MEARRTRFDRVECNRASLAGVSSNLDSAVTHAASASPKWCDHMALRAARDKSDHCGRRREVYACAGLVDDFGSPTRAGLAIELPRQIAAKARGKTGVLALGFERDRDRIGDRFNDALEARLPAPCPIARG